MYVSKNVVAATFKKERADFLIFKTPKTSPNTLQ